MRLFQNASIRRKQTLVIMLTSGIVLLLACAAFVAYDAVTFRPQLAENLSGVPAPECHREPLRGGH